MRLARCCMAQLTALPQLSINIPACQSLCEPLSQSSVATLVSSRINWEIGQERWPSVQSWVGRINPMTAGSSIAFAIPNCSDYAPTLSESDDIQSKELSACILSQSVRCGVSPDDTRCSSWNSTTVPLCGILTRVTVSV